MKIQKFLMLLTAASFVFASCEEKEKDTSIPAISISPESVEFEVEAGTSTFNVTSNRDWTIDKGADVDWLAFEPASGKASDKPVTVTITALENTSKERTASVKVKTAFDAKTLTVTQKEKEELKLDIIYANNFDKAKAEQLEEDDKKFWPSLDGTDAWSNEEGTGAGKVSYEYDGITVRSNSESNGNYSDYSGSGVNNLFFGKSAYIKVKDIALSAKTNYTVSFGTEKYVYGAEDNTFVPTEFHAYISNDGEKWVELEYAFPDGFKNGRWDLASSTFTVPSGTETLHLCFVSDIASAHRLDDLTLEESADAGTAIDFSKGEELTIGGGEEPGPEPGDITDATIPEFIAAEVSDTKLYRVKGKITRIVNTSYGNLYIQEGDDELYVYGVKKDADAGNQSFSELGAEVGDSITVVGYRALYGETIEMKNSYCEKLVKGTGGEGGDEGDENDYSSNISWTNGANAYDDGIATVNGVENVKVYKVGASKNKGTATIVIPKGTKKISYYAVAWKGSSVELSISYDGAEVYTQALAANDGATSNSPYTLTVTDSDHYTFDITKVLGEGGAPMDLSATVTTKGEKAQRFLIFGMKAE